MTKETNEEGSGESAGERSESRAEENVMGSENGKESVESTKGSREALSVKEMGKEIEELPEEEDLMTFD